MERRDVTGWDVTTRNYQTIDASDICAESNNSVTKALNKIKKDKQIMMSDARCKMNKLRSEIESIDDVIEMIERHGSQSGLL